MIINDKRALAYTSKILWIKPISGADNIELIGVLGWTCIAKKGEFQIGDLCVYFEIDSKLPEAEWSEFMRSKHFKIKTMKLNKFKVISQGLALPISIFTNIEIPQEEGIDLTAELGIVYADDEDNKRKAASADKYKLMAQRRPNIFKKKWARWMMRRNWGKKIMFFFFGKKKDKKNSWPVGVFPGVSKTDQERCENMPYILADKTPYIVTQKCDGSSGTYILERKGRNKFEFYVCSRNVRMLTEKQECFYGKDNYYWEVAIKYDIKNKMKKWLNANPNAKWVCWQGEICSPGIQKNPHKLTETHFYCFHWTDNINGRLDIISADKIWKEYDMEVVPIVDTNYILPDDFNEFKASVDNIFYDAKVCEGNRDCLIEGYVYYKTTDPTFSFKNVSRTYLLNH